ncbi:MAG: AI-2E family transporter [Gemmatimonadota bacterium]
MSDNPLRQAALQPTALRFLVGLAAFVIVVAGLKAAASLLVPVAFAVFMATILLPAIRALGRVGVSPILAIPVTLVAAIGVLFGFASLAFQSLTAMQEALPRYLARLQTMETEVIHFLADRGIPIDGDAFHRAFDPAQFLDFVGGTLRGAATFTTSLFLITIITMFLLAEAAGLPRKIALVARGADLTWVHRTAVEVQRYLAIKTVISVATGVLVGLWCLLLELDFPLFWGLTAFLLNYVPSIGSVIAAIPAVLLALVQLGSGTALAIAAGYLAINTLFGNIIEPAVMGRGLGLSPSVVIFSLLFWGFVWGPVGMLLSLPLTMIVKIILEQTELRAVAVLLGPAPPPVRRPEANLAAAPAQDAGEHAVSRSPGTTRG